MSACCNQCECEDCRCEKKKKNRSSCGFLKFLAFCAVVASLIALIRKFFCVLNEKDAQKNYNSEIRRYASCFHVLRENLKGIEVHCLKLSAFFSAAEIDLREAVIGPDITVDISGLASAIKILLPKECNVVNVAVCKNSAIDFDPEKRDGVPTVTFVGKVTGCAVSFTKEV